MNKLNPRLSADSNVTIIEDFVLDEFAKTFVSPLLPPNKRHFAVMPEGFGFFAEAFRKRKGKGYDMHILVERAGTDKPGHVKVRDIDGKVFVLEKALNFTPKPGACVQLVLGIHSKFIDEKAQYYNEEYDRKNNIRWV